MTKIRVVMIITTFLVVGLMGLFASYYARGYRFNLKTLKFSPNGILVIKSEPDGASVFINGELRTATNATVSLAPGVYDVEVKKDGFMAWSKRITIEKEVVTQATVSMFKNAPSLTPLTFSGASNPVGSKEGTRIAYTDKDGLYTTETYNLPIGFANSPKKITDSNLLDATYTFSPDGRQLMVNMSNGIFILESGSFTPQNEMVNVIGQKDAILATWNKEAESKNKSLLANLPEIVSNILTQEGADFLFSPDDTMVLYTPGTDAEIPNYLIPQLPGSSTQKQDRSIKVGQTYVYDIKEDRNFIISNQPMNKSSVFYWMPDSRHILNPTEGNIIIMDYDGTNKQSVYSGSYIAPYAFPYRNTTKLLILTNLGSTLTPNLYELTIK